MAYEPPRRRGGYLKAAHQWQCHAGVTPVPGAPPTSPSQPHAAAATRINNNSLLRVAVVVGQRVDINVVVRALEVQVLALHV